MSDTSLRFTLYKLVAVIVCVCLLVGAYLAGRWLMADLAEQNAARHLDSWRELNAVSSAADWQDAHDSLQRAIELKPDDAFLYQQLAVIYELKSLGSDNFQISEIEKTGARWFAVDAYRKSAQLRPAWPDGWAHLARMKATILQIDSEFFQAFENALLLGATEPRVDLELRPLCPLLGFFEVPETLDSFCSEETE